MEIASYGSIRDSEVCRTCLLELVDDTKIFYLDSILSTADKTTIRHKLRDCIPELDLNVTPNAAICFDCLSSINSSHSFKRRCLQTEKHLKKFARRTGSIFVDLAQLVEHNKKSHQYPDIDPLEIKQEPGISESHTYTRFFVKQEKLETTSDLSYDDDDIYQDSFYDDYSSDYSANVKQEPLDYESPTINEQPKTVVNNIVKNVMIKHKPVVPEPVHKMTNFKIILPQNNIYNNNNNQQKATPSPPPLKKIKLYKQHVPNNCNPTVENMQVKIKEKLLGNCAISLKEIPKVINNVLPVVAPSPPVNPKTIETKYITTKSEPEAKNESQDSCQVKVNNDEQKVQTIPFICKVANGGEVQVPVTQAKIVVDKPETRLMKCNNQETETRMTEKPPSILLTSNNVHNLQMKSEPTNLVYAILTLVKPGSPKPEPINVLAKVENLKSTSPVVVNKPQSNMPTISRPRFKTSTVGRPRKIYTVTKPVMKTPTIDKQETIQTKTPTIGKQETVETKTPTIDKQETVQTKTPTIDKQEIVQTKTPIIDKQETVGTKTQTIVPETPTVDKHDSFPVSIKTEPISVPCDTEPIPVSDTKPIVSFDSKIENSKDVQPVVAVNIVQELPSPPSHLLTQTTEPPKLVKIEPKPTLPETIPTTPESNEAPAQLGYNVDINNLPPLAPLSESLTNFDDGITHLECTPNIADYVDDDGNEDDIDEDDSLHKCNDCEFECKGKSDFILHLSTHLEEKFGIKPEPPIKKRDLYGRVKTLGGKLVYECEVCNYRTALKRRYLFHTKLHQENKLLKCTQCDYLCATKSNLNVHMAVHTGHKPHKCTECGYGTVSKSALIVHTRIHTGDRPYSCGVCGYCTISKSALIVHNRIHTGSKPYRCPTCNYRTITKSSLTVHMRTHTGDKPFKCHLCEYSTRAKSALNVHVRIHEGYKPYQCTECEYRCSQRSGLNVHMRVHTGDKPFQCTECDYRCSNKSSLVVHYRTHTGETPYKCDECDYTTAWKSALNVHTRIHGDRKPFRCTECDYKCAQRSTLNVHMRIHTGDKPYQCAECDYRCRYQGNLKMHMRIHTRETPFKCSLCDYSTTAKSALIVHNRIHTGEKPFKCNECPYKCSTKSSLKIHSRIHTGETPYECKRCLYKASSNSALKVHLRIHTGEKPFKCSYCSYRASNKGSIKVHLRVHTGETPYECSVCDYKTTAKSALIVHMRIHTGDKPYKCEECSYRCNNKSSLKVHLKVHTGRTPYRCEICDYRCKKKFVLKRHLRVHRKEEEADDDEAGETNEANENEPSTPDNLITVKNEIDDSLVINEEEMIEDDDGEGETLIGSGYEGDLDVSNIQPEFPVIAV